MTNRPLPFLWILHGKRVCLRYDFIKIKANYFYQQIKNDFNNYNI